MAAIVVAVLVDRVDRRLGLWVGAEPGPGGAEGHVLAVNFMSVQQCVPPCARRYGVSLNRFARSAPCVRF